MPPLQLLFFDKNFRYYYYMFKAQSLLQITIYYS